MQQTRASSLRASRHSASTVASQSTLVSHRNSSRSTAVLVVPPITHDVSMGVLFRTTLRTPYAARRLATHADSLVPVLPQALPVVVEVRVPIARRAGSDHDATVAGGLDYAASGLLRRTTFGVRPAPRGG